MFIFLYTSPYEHVQFNVSGANSVKWLSITSALGQCIVLSGVSDAGMLKRHQHNAAVNAVSTTGQRRRLWASIETVLGEFHVFAQSTQQTR